MACGGTPSYRHKGPASASSPHPSATGPECRHPGPRPQRARAGRRAGAAAAGAADDILNRRLLVIILRSSTWHACRGRARA